MATVGLMKENKYRKGERKLSSDEGESTAAFCRSTEKRGNDENTPFYLLN
jgi:hypothetical protein